MAITTWTDVDRALANREPLYIRNKARHKQNNAAMIIVINYPSPEGDKSFSIPRISIPFNICDHVDQESLRNSSSFRKAFNNGKIEIVPKEVADRELQDPVMQEAVRAAIYESDSSTIYQARAKEIDAARAAEADLRAEKQADSGGLKHMLAAMDPNLAKALNITRSDGLFQDPRLVDAEAQSRLGTLRQKVKANGGMNPDQVVRELTMLVGELTLNDFQAIASDNFWPLEAQKWARERIQFAMETLNARA